MGAVAKLPKTLYDGRVRKIIFASILPILLSAILFLSLTINSFAQESLKNDISMTHDPPTLYTSTQNVTFTFKSANLFKTQRDYTLGILHPRGEPNAFNRYPDSSTNDPSILIFTVRIDDLSNDSRYGPGIWSYKLWLGGGNDKFNESRVIATGQFFIYNCKNVNDSGCPSPVVYGSTFATDTMLDVYIVNPQPDHTYAVWFMGEDKTTKELKASNINETYTTSKGEIFKAAKIQINTGPPSKSKTLCLTENIPTFLRIQANVGCDFHISDIVITALEVPIPTGIQPPIQGNKPGVPSGVPELPGYSGTPPPPPQCAEWNDLEKNIISKEQVVGRKDVYCVAVDTGIGLISTDPKSFVKSVMGITLSLAGGIAMILLIFSGYKFMASQGNPEALQAARDQFLSAIIGLLFIIFSLVILQIIGVDILNIPGFKP